MLQVFSVWPVKTEAQIPSQGSQCGIFGGQNNTKKGKLTGKEILLQAWKGA
jgi:hypothetical protein